eukprot:15330-Pelagococcus_subviridis.AAC.6
MRPRPYALSPPAPFPDDDAFFPKLNTATPRVIARTWRYCARGNFRPAATPPIMTGTILHDFPSTCVAYETYRSASFADAIASICDTPDVRIWRRGTRMPLPPTSARPIAPASAFTPRSTARTRNVDVNFSVAPRPAPGTAYDARYTSSCSTANLASLFAAIFFELAAPIAREGGGRCRAFDGARRGGGVPRASRRRVASLYSNIRTAASTTAHNLTYQTVTSKSRRVAALSAVTPIDRARAAEDGARGRRAILAKRFSRRRSIMFRSLSLANALLLFCAVVAVLGSLSTARAAGIAAPNARDDAATSSPHSAAFAAYVAKHGKNYCGDGVVSCEESRLRCVSGSMRSNPPRSRGASRPRSRPRATRSVSVDSSPNPRFVRSRRRDDR